MNSVGFQKVDVNEKLNSKFLKEIKKRINKGEDVNDVAILVPKNRQVRSTITILKDVGVPVAGGEMMDLFDSPEAMSFLQVLKILADPDNGVALGASFFDKLSLFDFFFID